MANPARLAEHNITKIYLCDKNLPSEIFYAFLEIKNVEIFVNHSDSPEILAHKNIHLKGNELHLAKSLKSVDCFDLPKANLAMTDSGVEWQKIVDCHDSTLRVEFRNDRKILSYSAHSLSDILNAHSAKIDYIFISPIFAVENKNPPLGVEFLAQIPREIKPKIFALGGINKTNIHAFENLGIAGIAGIRAFDKIFK